MSKASQKSELSAEQAKNDAQAFQEFTGQVRRQLVAEQKSGHRFVVIGLISSHWSLHMRAVVNVANEWGVEAIQFTSAPAGDRSFCSEYDHIAILSLPQHKVIERDAA